MYPAEIVLPMKAELTDAGFDEMVTAAEVSETLGKQGTTLVVINSVCGCAAGTCRPGVLMAVQNATNRPDRLTTSFAGFDVEAVNEVRKLSFPYPPSSPAIALFKDGVLVNLVERHQIEGRPAQVIAQHLISIFDEHCN
jgi:putative YphP/YqiW family bacilliredoxin